MFVVLLLCLVGVFKHCHHLVVEKEAGCFAFFSIVCLGLFAHPFDVTDRLCSMTLAFPGHLLSFFDSEMLFCDILAMRLSFYSTRGSKIPPDGS